MTEARQTGVTTSTSASGPGLEATAKRSLVAALVVGGVIVGSLALWKLRVVVGLLLFAVTIASAMRPSVEWLARKGIPRGIGVLLHYFVLLALIAIALSFVVPRLTTEVQTAITTAQANPGHNGDGVKAKVLDAVQKRLHDLPSGTKLVTPALSIGEEAFKILLAALFTLASAAYWIFERDRAVDLVASFMPRPKRKKMRDTWTLIDQKLGAFVRGELLLIAFVSTTMSVLLGLVGEPYWLLVGITTGFLEIVPVVGPMAAFVLVVGAGMTDSWQTAAIAGGIMLAVRLLEDYLVTPRVLGGAVGLSPLVTLVSVSVVAILFGGFYVLLSIPLASLVVTVVDVAVRGVEPSEVEVPTVLFPSADAER